MECIKKFINCAIPVTACNFRCHYCYITQSKLWAQKQPEFLYTPEHIVKSLSVKRMGGICLFNLCGGGETLLPKEVVPITVGMLQEGHFVSIITNGTITRRMNELIELPADSRDRLMLKFSFQFFELKRLRLLDEFFCNIKRIRDAGISFSLELVANDEMIADIPEIKDLCMKNVGALCHIVIPRVNTTKSLDVLTKLPEQEFLDIWSQFDSPLFDFKRSNLHVSRQEQFCYAGLWTGDLDVGNGNFRQCHNQVFVQNLFEDPTEPFHGYPCGKNCEFSFCYNAHAFLSLGAIPEMGKDVPTYASFRDRVCSDGSHWLTPRMAAFLSSKLYDSNGEWTDKEKLRWEKEYSEHVNAAQQGACKK